MQKCKFKWNDHSDQIVNSFMEYEQKRTQMKDWIAQRTFYCVLSVRLLCSVNTCQSLFLAFNLNNFAINSPDCCCVFFCLRRRKRAHVWLFFGINCIRFAAQVSDESLLWLPTNCRKSTEMRRCARMIYEVIVVGVVSTRFFVHSLFISTNFLLLTSAKRQASNNRPISCTVKRIHAEAWNNEHIKWI